MVKYEYSKFGRERNTVSSKICCFTGHRIIFDNEMINLPKALEKTLHELYSLGVREFRAGGAIGFDSLASLTVIAFRETHPDVRLALILPCRDQDSRWGTFDREIYAYILKCADSVMYIEDSYTPDCMHKRNRSLIQGSDYCVAYQKEQDGGSAYTVAHAKKSGVTVINLADQQDYQI